MARKKTVGYIVIAGDGRPMSWSDDDGHFYYADNPTPIYGRDEYETVRRHVGRHLRAMNHADFAPDVQSAFDRVEIVSLVDWK